MACMHACTHTTGDIACAFKTMQAIIARARLVTARVRAARWAGLVACGLTFVCHAQSRSAAEMSNNSTAAVHGSCPSASHQHGGHCLCSHSTSCVGPTPIRTHTRTNELEHCHVASIGELQIHGFKLRACPQCRCVALEQQPHTADANPIADLAQQRTRTHAHALSDQAGVCLSREQYHAGAGSWQKRIRRFRANGTKGGVLVPPEEDTPCCSWDRERGQPDDWVSFCTSRRVFYTVGRASLNHHDYRLIVDRKDGPATPSNFDAVVPVAQFGGHGCTSSQLPDPRSASQVIEAAHRVGEWEWVPTTCRLPRFSTVEFCRRLAGQSVSQGKGRRIGVRGVP